MAEQPRAHRGAGHGARRRRATPTASLAGPRCCSAWASSARPTAPRTPSSRGCRSATTASASRSGVMKELKPGVPFKLPESPKAPAGHAAPAVLLSEQPALVRMAAGLDFFREYPYGCTEQQLSRARAYVAFRKFRALLGQKGGEKDVDTRGEGRAGLHPHRRRPERPRGLLAGLAGLRLAHRLDACSSWSRRRPPASPSDEKLLARLLRSARAGAALRLQPLHRRRELRRARLGPRGPAPGRAVQPRLRGRAGAQGRSSSTSKAWPRCSPRSTPPQAGAPTARRRCRADSRRRPRHAPPPGQGDLRRPAGAPAQRATASSCPARRARVAEVARAFARRDPTEHEAARS